MRQSQRTTKIFSHFNCSIEKNLYFVRKYIWDTATGLEPRTT